MANVAGPIFALVTPFAEDDLALDEAALRASLQFLTDKVALLRTRLAHAHLDRCSNSCVCAQGVTDVVSCGTTGEFSSMSLDERRRVTEIVAEECHPRGVRVVCHIRCSANLLTTWKLSDRGNA